MKTIPAILLFFLPHFLLSQTDSLHYEEVTITAYFTKQPLLQVPASAAVVDSLSLDAQNGQSLAGAMNTVPGVRMEERSPGSYRLSIRGSLLRSPFGIRNVKMYFDEFPLTDAGGNTYLNLIDPACVARVEVLKGPDGSLFGANSGGVVRIRPAGMEPDSFRVAARALAGSYGLFRQHVTAQFRVKQHVFSISEAWQRSDGYRENSAFDRKYAQGTGQLVFGQAKLRFLVFYSDLDYRTPGGLTEAQWNANPRAARPAGLFPGAVQQKAGVHNSTVYGGAMYEAKLGRHFRHCYALFRSFTYFENPFITNYETRAENSGGVRTWLEASGGEGRMVKWNAHLGGELQQTHSRTHNFGNAGGSKDSLQAGDELLARQSFVFLRGSAAIAEKWLAEAAMSLNYFSYAYERVFPADAAGNRSFAPQLMPRVALSRRFGEWLAWRVSWARGYSPPTLAEIRSSDNTINTQLQPETGWNYETGFRLQDPQGRLWWDASVFLFRLEDAIVRRLNDAGQEYFVNAGATSQPGVESQLIVHVLRGGAGFVRGLEVRNAFTFHTFTFSNYRDATTDYSGNRLTGVPRSVVVTGLNARLAYGFSVFAQHNYTSSIPLNDANTAFAGDYHLVLVKASWRKEKARFIFEIFAGIDNLAGEKYSLGNDLNAAGGRYFNAAPGRSWFGGMSVWLR